MYSVLSFLLFCDCIQLKVCRVNIIVVVAVENQNDSRTSA
jgi:hypothetical protein